MAWISVKGEASQADGENKRESGSKPKLIAWMMKMRKMRGGEEKTVKREKKHSDVLCILFTLCYYCPRLFLQVFILKHTEYTACSSDQWHVVGWGVQGYSLALARLDTYLYVFSFVVFSFAYLVYCNILASVIWPVCCLQCQNRYSVMEWLKVNIDEYFQPLPCCLSSLNALSRKNNKRIWYSVDWIVNLIAYTNWMVP